MCGSKLQQWLCDIPSISPLNVHPKSQTMLDHVRLLSGKCNHLAVHAQPSCRLCMPCRASVKCLRLTKHCFHIRPLKKKRTWSSIKPLGFRQKTQTRSFVFWNSSLFTMHEILFFSTFLYETNVSGCTVGRTLWWWYEWRTWNMNVPYNNSDNNDSKIHIFFWKNSLFFHASQKNHTYPVQLQFACLKSYVCSLIRTCPIRLQSCL